MAQTAQIKWVIENTIWILDSPFLFVIKLRTLYSKRKIDTI